MPAKSRVSELLVNDDIIEAWDVDPNATDGVFNGIKGGMLEEPQFRAEWHTLRDTWDIMYGIRCNPARQQRASHRSRSQPPTSGRDDQAGHLGGSGVESSNDTTSDALRSPTETPSGDTQHSTSRAAGPRVDDSARSTSHPDRGDASDPWSLCQGNRAVYYLHMCLKKHHLEDDICRTIDAFAAAAASGFNASASVNGGLHARASKKRSSTAANFDDHSFPATALDRPIRLELGVRENTEILKLCAAKHNESLVVQLKEISQLRSNAIMRGETAEFFDCAIAKLNAKILLYFDTL